MNRQTKFLKSYLEFKFQNVLAGSTTLSKNHSLITAKIKNKNLISNLESLTRQEGVLTYKEFLDIIQFGDYGYHKTHSIHGMTDTNLRWGLPILNICKEKKYREVIEFGCGEGSLGVEICKYAKQVNYPLIWSGIDINKSLLEKTRKNFAKANLSQYLGKLTEDIDAVSAKKACLLIFSYSLDSISPTVFINTKKTPGPPNALLGIFINDGVLSETILTPSQMHKKKMSLKNGIYKDESGEFNLSSWKLFPQQRVYIPIGAISILLELIKKIPIGSTVIIIDEFVPQPLSSDDSDMCPPKDLDRFGRNRSFSNLEEFYNTSGENLLYYSSYLETYKKALNSLGCDILNIENEYSLSRKLSKGKDRQGMNALQCFAIIATKTGKPKKTTVLLF